MAYDAGGQYYDGVSDITQLLTYPSPGESGARITYVYIGVLQVNTFQSENVQKHEKNRLHFLEFGYWRCLGYNRWNQSKVHHCCCRSEKHRILLLGR